ncbi:MAG: glycosyltransferase family 4 protein [Chloroflexi bacterium]|nr:glycosyltransferase family 4 protein [Chloroflexota bacterium]
MRILVINSEYPPIGGGAGNASANIARWFVAFGHEVAVLTAHFEGLPRVESRDGLTVHRIPALRRKQDRSGALEQLAFILSGTFYALGLTRRFKPDVTLAFFGMPSGAIAWLLKKLYRIPYVVSLRGGDVPGFRPYDFKVFHKLIGPFLHVIWHAAARVIANSHGLGSLARAFDAGVDIPIIPNGVDGSRFDAGQRDWASPRLLSAGRIVYQKGLDLGMRALAQLQELDWHWYIAGDGPQMAALKSLAHELGIGERVTFLGWQSQEELADGYHQANLFLFPSRHEGMPNAVLEAMASGLPVVATRIAGSEELVVDGETGMLVSPEDVDSLRDGLRALLIDADKRERMGHASRLRVEREYSWESVARQYSEYLEKIM